jgi:hypothetical protein
MPRNESVDKQNSQDIANKAEENVKARDQVKQDSDKAQVSFYYSLHVRKTVRANGKVTGVKF